jgi:hypothetical protein
MEEAHWFRRLPLADEGGQLSCHQIDQLMFATQQFYLVHLDFHRPGLLYLDDTSGRGRMKGFFSNATVSARKIRDRALASGSVKRIPAPRSGAVAARIVPPVVG